MQLFYVFTKFDTVLSLFVGIFTNMKTNQFLECMNLIHFKMNSN